MSLIQQVTCPAPEYRGIPLSQGQIALVDAADFEWLNQHKWYARKEWNTWHAFRNVVRDDGEKRIVAMHRQLMGFPPCDVDHEDLDGLHNWRLNLRRATRAQTVMNRRARSDNKAGLKGASLDPWTGRWKAAIKVNGKQVTLGRYDSAEEAHAAYVVAARSAFGEFARGE